METNKLSEREFGELFSIAYDGVGKRPTLSEKDVTEFLETLAFSLSLTINTETGIKVSEGGISQQLMLIYMSDEEITQDKENLSIALLERLKYVGILQRGPDSDKKDSQE